MYLCNKTSHYGRMNLLVEGGTADIGKWPLTIAPIEVFTGLFCECIWLFQSCRMAIKLVIMSEESTCVGQTAAPEK